MPTTRGIPSNPVIQTSAQLAKPAGRNDDKKGDWTGKTNAFLSEKPARPTLPPEPNPQAPTDYAEIFRHSGWRPYRERIRKALRKTAGVSPRRVAAFEFCGQDASVECRLIGIHNTPEYRIRSTKCHDRFCVPCAKERSNRVRDALAVHMYKRTNMSLITLTLKHQVGDLTIILDRITRCFRALRTKKVWSSAVQGGCAIIETKVSTDDTAWNVHYHVLAETKYIRTGELAAAWLAITGDSHVVDIRRVQAHSGAIKYVTNYVTKGGDHSIVMSPKHLTQAIVAFTGRRLITTFGTWRGLQLMEKVDEHDEPTLRTEWRSCGTLDDLFRRAIGGDIEAITILRKLAPHKFRPRIKPPDPPDIPTHL